MIGFPLRLLARENYDRVVKLVGARNAALVTGEEKIVPPTARYFLCTVESMPLERPVSFLGIDEVQLAAEEDRYRVGLSTNFLVLTRQNDLAAAKLAEIQALTDYRTALTELARATGALLEARHRAHRERPVDRVEQQVVEPGIALALVVADERVAC